MLSLSLPGHLLVRRAPISSVWPITEVSEGKGDSNPDGLAVAGVRVWSSLGGCDVLGARALLALAERKRHAVAFAE